MGLSKISCYSSIKNIFLTPISSTSPLFHFLVPLFKQNSPKVLSVIVVLNSSFQVLPTTVRLQLITTVKLIDLHFINLIVHFNNLCDPSTSFNRVEITPSSLIDFLHLASKTASSPGLPLNFQLLLITLIPSSSLSIT